MSISKKSIKYSFLAEFHIILLDLKRIFNYVEPSDQNLKTFSHRIYELLLRTSTAFESLSKRILIEDGYTKKPEKMNIKDYFKLNELYGLSRYKILIDSWSSGSREFSPYANWNNTTYKSLSWYIAYNNTKHDRYQNFKEANLENLLDAIGGLFVLLYTQFGSDVFNNYQQNTDYDSDERGFIFYPDFIFAIKEPEIN